MIIYGPIIDDQTRCVHYSLPEDVIAIKFACCKRYYPCFFCHEELADHPVRLWPVNQRAEKAILCGVCSTELSIAEYQSVQSCPSCSAPFNKQCRLHWHLYFES